MPISKILQIAFSKEYLQSTNIEYITTIIDISNQNNVIIQELDLLMLGIKFTLNIHVELSQMISLFKDRWLHARIINM